MVPAKMEAEMRKILQWLVPIARDTIKYVVMACAMIIFNVLETVVLISAFVLRLSFSYSLW